MTDVILVPIQICSDELPKYREQLSSQRESAVKNDDHVGFAFRHLCKT
jgi:hypothetical protein